MKIYSFGISVASLQNKKAGLWISGRKDWKENYRKAMSAIVLTEGPKAETVWMHCSSLGEFEQGRPLIEGLKKDNPSLRIVISFFSPSGYEIMKTYQPAAMVCYLPMDGPANAKDFIDIIRPTLVLWVKYEYWYYYLKEIHQRGIPLLLISGIFRLDQPFFKWYGKLYRDILQNFTFLFVQNSLSADLASRVTDPAKLVISGDPRFDRVIEIAEKFKAVEHIERWLDKTGKVLVAGSTWDEDEKELVHYVKLHPEIKFVIAPHNINEAEIRENLELFRGAQLYSRLLATNGESPSSSNVLIIDNVGLLSRLYHYATITYIGGGFGDEGVHNVLEAAVYSKPVVHGPEYEKYAEAKGLVEAGGAIEVEDALELEKVLNKLFSDADFYIASSTAAGKFVYDSRGAAAKIIEYIYKNRLVTSSLK